MHLITGVLSAIGVALIGLIGHIVAHDFCERTPALGRWLLSIATNWLPPSIRERYAEEWAAHLAERQGVIAKLHHAFGCLWCARRLRHQEFKGMTLRVSFNLPALGPVVVQTNVYELGIVLWLYQLFRRTKPTNYAYVGALTLLFWRRIYVDARERSGVTGQDFARFLKDSKRGDWVPTAIQLTLDNQTIDLIRLLRACGHSLAKMLKQMVKALSPLKR
jgi:hypothetical protein